MKKLTSNLSTKQKTLQKEIRAWRKVYGRFEFTSKMIAEMVLGVSPNTLSNIASGYYVPAVGKLKMYLSRLREYYEEKLK
jgi:hypothetical protein